MDPIELSIFSSRIEAVCDEMGAVLRRAALSPNIRDRLDFSCAVFDTAGRLCAQAAHIPVHLGSMAYAMADLVQGQQWSAGDMVVVNDPYLGGTHLPDVTVIAPVFVARTCIGFVANRAHHADIGASTPGSMPISRTLQEEGMVIAPSYLLRRGTLDDRLLDSITGATANPAHARGDFAAQISANRAGVARLAELAETMGAAPYSAALDALNAYGERLAASALSDVPAGRYVFRDLMDDDGMGHRDIPIVCAVEIADGRAHVDFTGTGQQVAGNINCPLSVAAAGVYYAFRCLMPEQTAACAGAFSPLTVHAPEGCLLNAMNNLAMGARTDERSWDYYETAGGGMGAGPHRDGLSGVQSHMTNTRNTPVEVLEMTYPVRVRRYGLRRGSGGRGLHRGGDGLVREFEFLEPTTVTLLTERRRHRPWGLRGGEAGLAGENRRGSEVLPPKVTLHLAAGERLTLCTPGGGGWGQDDGEKGVGDK
ncbi:MAG: hydantoinase B/oxoprolinase family protein [Gammaproteobacteria bacterium]